MKLQHMAWLISFLTGFASLSLEVVWVRVMAFSEGNSPRVLSLVLGLYLIGIVVGAWMGRYITKSGDVKVIRTQAGLTLGFSAVIDGLTPVLLTFSATSVWTIPLMSCLILLSASTKAAMFPVVHHLGSEPGRDDTGRTFSKVYFFNILGATFGPLLVGFCAFDWATSQQLMIGFGLLILMASMLLMQKIRWHVMAAFSALPMIISLVNANPNRMMTGLAFASDIEHISFFSENRYGFIHTVNNTSIGDAIFGGNIYDGRLSVDPIQNSNRIDRLLLLAGLHPAPKRVLVIGLSGGAWVRVLMEFPNIQSIDVVELNPGYRSLVAQTPVVAPLLNDSRVMIHFDDGRRWLKKFDGPPFDLIIMNTTFHWRAYASNLLSSDFLKTAHTHLASDGILAFNSTDSPDTVSTAAQVFNYSFRRDKSNFVYASDHDFSKMPLNSQPIKAVIESLMDRTLSGEGLKETLESIASPRWISVAEQENLTGRGLEVITDQNMLTEYRYGRQ